MNLSQKKSPAGGLHPQVVFLVGETYRFRSFPNGLLWVILEVDGQIVPVHIWY